jgi:peptide/nickel transport system permease protein
VSDTASSASGAAAAPRRRRRSALRRLLSEPLGAIGLVLVVAVVLVAIFAGVVAHHSPIALAPIDRFQPPSDSALAARRA